MRFGTAGVGRRLTGMNGAGGVQPVKMSDRLCVAGVDGHVQIIGRSAGMKAVADAIHKVSQTTGNVLIFGESGTGKELVARQIHAAG